MNDSLPPPVPPPVNETVPGGPPVFDVPIRGGRSRVPLLLGGCAVLMVALAAVLFFAGRFLLNFRGPSRMVEAHMDAISKGEYSDAYRCFSEDYRRSNSFRDFQMELHPFFTLIPFRERAIQRVKISNEQAIVEGTITGKDGAVFAVYYKLNREGGEWRITGYRWEFPGERIAI